VRCILPTPWLPPLRLSLHRRASPAHFSFSTTFRRVSTRRGREVGLWEGRGCGACEVPHMCAHVLCRGSAQPIVLQTETLALSLVLRLCARSVAEEDGHPVHQMKRVGCGTPSLHLSLPGGLAAKARQIISFPTRGLGSGAPWQGAHNPRVAARPADTAANLQVTFFEPRRPRTCSPRPEA
jgi:hypothetical protein